MKFVSENFKDLRPLFINQLRTMLSGEEQLVTALPSMVEHATDPELQEAFRTHLQETEVHVRRLEELLSAAKSLDPNLGAVDPLKNKGIKALIAEADDMMLDARDAFVRDAALIATAQRIEHYEIAAYGALRHFAGVLGEAGAVEVLSQTIQEEGHADHVLTAIAERVNVDARRSAA